MMKDNFSKQAYEYKKYRPVYPKALYDFLLAQNTRQDLAWDCATGNGQVAEELSKYFKQVLATDISQKQLDKAPKLPNVHFELSEACHSGLDNNSVDLLTVAQGLHWFATTMFFNEAKRVLRPMGIMACWSYGLIQGSPAFNQVIGKFYSETIGAYWDEERSHVDNAYASIPFPNGTKTKHFEMPVTWSLEHFLGYLNSWSAVQHYLNKTGIDIVSIVADKFQEIWKVEYMDLYFPITLKWCKNG